MLKKDLNWLILSYLSQTKYKEIYYYIQKNVSLDKIISKYINNDIKKLITLWNKYINDNNINFVTYDDPLYPIQLKQIYHPPLCLFYYGNIKLLKNINNNISIVGTRNNTHYAKMVLMDIFALLKKYECCTVSGLALGVDTIVHTQSIKNNIATIAVLGTALDKNNVYPKNNKRLVQDIINKNGLILSEYIIGFKNHKTNFLKRNRIIAALSTLTIIIEAPQKSGALNTANHAIEQNRDLLVLPNNIYEKNALGTNLLIQKGANILLKPNDILNFKDLKIKNCIGQHDDNII